MKDILLYMSDQHSYRLQGNAGDPVVRTKMMDELARTGTVMTNAITPCPLCVPARAAMISGQLPSNNGVLFNFNSLHSDLATFLHSLTVSGYETTLCGRMHFVGPDQRHGYAKRIAGDRTPVFHNAPPANGAKKVVGFDENSSVQYIGKGDSPVLAYDRYVTEQAVAYLNQNHERPQFLTVGIYGPHFPYVAPPELYDYYYDKVPLDDVAAADWEHPALEGKMLEPDLEVARAARAAYYGLVETVDRHMETVYRAFQDYLKRNGREGVFIYISDHGDMNGARGYYGKQVFYEPSVHIPFIIQGDGIPQGKVIDSPVSLLDIGPTVCDLAGAEKIPGDGKSLFPLLQGEQDENRAVISEQYTYLANGEASLGRMVCQGAWKLITYSGFPDNDILFNTRHDPQEKTNLIEKEPEIADALRAIASGYPASEDVLARQEWFTKQLRFLIKCDYDDTDERWECPDLPLVDEPVRSKKPFEPTPWARLMRQKLDKQ